MKKIILALFLAGTFAFSACGTTTETPDESSSQVISSKSITEETEYELNSDYVGTWYTGENEDTRAISINEDLTWQVLNIDDIEGFEETGGQVKVTEDAVELYDGDELYDTVYFGAEEDTLYSGNGYTYTRETDSEKQVITEYVGVWQTGENEDMAYLVILDDETWKLLPADEEEGADEFGGTVEMAEDSAELYQDDELYDTVYFGAEENTLYSSFGITYELVSKDYNETGE